MCPAANGHLSYQLLSNGYIRRSVLAYTMTQPGWFRERGGDITGSGEALVTA